MNRSGELGERIRRIEHSSLMVPVGRVEQFFGMTLEAKGPDAFLGEICQVVSPDVNDLFAEVVGFKNGKVVLLPLGDVTGVRVGALIVPTGKASTISVGAHLIGQVVDAFGKPYVTTYSSQTSESSSVEYPHFRQAENPMEREIIRDVFETGIASIDTMLTLGRGQRVGIFAGSGVGKSTLMGMLARNSTSDVNVIALIGERGREVVEFIEDSLGEDGLKKSIVVVATADQPALVRIQAAYTAMAIAEFFKDCKKDVLLLMDSLTRFALAQREKGLAAGEPTTVRGYTPSSFSTLPQLIERAGNFVGKGSITAIYTVLVDGDDLNEPLSDQLRAVLDGHIVLSRKLANKGIFPAIDQLSSLSRLANKLRTKEQNQLVLETIGLFSAMNDGKDLIDLGVYQPGRNKTLDRSVEKMPLIQELLQQDVDESKYCTEIFIKLKTILSQ